MSLPNPDWLEERAKCDMESLWKDVCELMEKNLSRFEVQAEEHSWSQRYGEVTRKSSNKYLAGRYVHRKAAGVLGWTYDAHGQYILFRATHTLNTEGEPDTFQAESKLTTRWDAASSQCRVVVTQAAAQGEEPPSMELPYNELWKALQYILEPFFFPRDITVQTNFD